MQSLTRSSVLRLGFAWSAQGPEGRRRNMGCGPRWRRRSSFTAWGCGGSAIVGLHRAHRHWCRAPSSWRGWRLRPRRWSRLSPKSHLEPSRSARPHEPRPRAPLRPDRARLRRQSSTRETCPRRRPPRHRRKSPANHRRAQRLTRATPPIWHRPMAPGPSRPRPRARRWSEPGSRSRRPRPRMAERCTRETCPRPRS
jgi:hypothetical protein